MITKLPSGNSLITKSGFKEKIIKVMTEKGFSIVILDNKFEYGSDAWANKEIENSQILKQYS